MLKNNIEVDVKIKCIEAGKTQAQLGEATVCYRIIKNSDSIINKTFVQMLDALGYDIELHYVKKEEESFYAARMQDKSFGNKGIPRITGKISC